MIAEVNTELVALFDQDPESARSHTVRLRSLTAADFEHAAAAIVPQTRPEELARYQRWARDLE
jgi:hypothetical protein